MTKARLPGNGAPKRPPTSTSEPQWYVRLYLGDQCDWFIGGKVIARTEDRAIVLARAQVRNGWPLLTPMLESAPASATQVH
jgi:hypothetical protein